jgi:hypothetical protein
MDMGGPSLYYSYFDFVPEKAEARPKAISAPPETLRCARRRRALPRSCEESPSRIAAPAHQREKNAQLKDPEHGVAPCRVDELRKKCQEKQGALGITQIDEHA